MPRAPSVPRPDAPPAFADLFPPATRGWYTYDEWRDIARKALERGLIDKDDLSREAMDARAARNHRLRALTHKGGLTYILLLRLDAVAKAIRAGVDEREFGMAQLGQRREQGASNLRLL